MHCFSVYRTSQSAREDRQIEKSNLLSTVLGEIDRSRKLLDDKGIIAVIKSMKKSNDKCLDVAIERKAIEKLECENSILNKYLPKNLSIDAVCEIIGQNLDKLEGLSFNRQIGVAKGLFKGFDGEVNGKDIVSALKEMS